MNPWLAGALGAALTLCVVVWSVALYRMGKQDGIKEERDRLTGTDVTHLFEPKQEGNGGPG